MLVLARKQEESFWIGPDVRITVVRIDREQVRIGIEAPQGVTVLREELVGTDWTRPNKGNQQ